MGWIPENYPLIVGGATVRVSGSLLVNPVITRMFGAALLATAKQVDGRSFWKSRRDFQKLRPSY